MLIFLYFSSARVTCVEQKRCITAKMSGGQYLKAEIVRKTGKNLLSDPLFNKGLGFPRTERDRLGIRGLVPPSTLVFFYRHLCSSSHKNADMIRYLVPGGPLELEATHKL